jgi:DNA-binding NtrC family response regulator
VQVPSLNERPDDILSLARHFLLEFSRKFGKLITGISPGAESALMTHRWTGHVRELRNLIERGVLIGKGPALGAEDLGIGSATKVRKLKRTEDGMVFPPLSGTGIDLATVQESLEWFYFKEALKLARDNESKAAGLLNMNHRTFRYRRKKLRVKLTS